MLFIVISVFFGVLLIDFLLRGLRNPLSHVPGPWYSRYTTLVLTYVTISGRRTHYVHELHEKYGKVVRVSPHEVDFSSVTGAKRIHAFVRPFPKAKMYDALTKDGGALDVFSTRDFDVHSKHRRLLSSGLSEGWLKKSEHVVRARATLAVERIGEEMKEHGAADVLKWCLFFATDVIGELTFGDSFRMLEQGKKNQYIHDLEGLAKADGLGIVFPNITKIASYLPLPLFNAAKASKARLASYAAESIGRYEKLVAAEPDNPKLTLLTKLFNPKEETLRRIDILAAAQGYIIAGSDTTANSLTYLLWAVCRNPSIRARLAEEVAGLPETYRDEDLKTLPYLSQVIKETLRLYGAAPAFLPREVTQGGAEIDGYWMPAGTEVQTQAYSMHRDATVFPDPERFNPSRWESPSREMQDAWMPFGGGARICLGLHLALMEMRLAVAGFFRAFPNAKAAMRDGFNDEEMEQVIFFLMFPKGKRCMIQAS